MEAYNYTDLNAQLSKINKQMETLAVKKEELIKAIEIHKKNFLEKFHNLNMQLMDCVKELLEMGVDITTLPKPNETCEEAVPSISEEEQTIDTTDIASDELITANVDNDEIEEDLEISDTKQKLQTPYFYLCGYRKGDYKKNCTVPRWKHTVPRLLKPLQILTKGPINMVMNMGNNNYRESYSTPDEGRIYSANGIAPTLTATHSALRIKIGRDPRPREVYTTEVA